MDTRNDLKYKDSGLLTRKQWECKGMVPRDGASGVRLYPNGHRRSVFEYFAPEDVRPMTEEEREPAREKRREKRRAQREREKKQRLEQYDLITTLQHDLANIDDIWRERAAALRNLLMEEARRRDIIPCDNPSKAIVLDVETTGLSRAEDEILQISILDGDGNILLNSYVKPYYSSEWDGAYAFHHISKEMVENAPYPHELLPVVAGIVQSADLIIGYNVEFDLEFLSHWGLCSDAPIYDVMHAYAEYNGEWDEKHGRFRCELPIT